MFIYIFILFAACFMGLMFYLIKTSPYGHETKDGIRFFKSAEEMEKYISEHEKDVDN